LAAYLHDIGKGPKSRWASNNGLQKVDPNHPVSAMPMMVEILTQYIGKVKRENANLILKLVCYHDLVGEVLGKGRDEQQIVDVAENKLELDMLFAIGKADATSLCESWWDENQATALYNRCLKAIKLNSGKQ
jgi:HD domain